MQVRSRIRLNLPRIRELTEAAVTALEKTAEAVHTEVVQAQVMPRDTGAMQGERTFIKAGESISSTYENGAEAVNTITKEKGGKVSIITTSPQVRRLYYHPEYHFQTTENPNAKGKWLEDWEPGGSQEDFAVEAFKELYRREADV